MELSCIEAKKMSGEKLSSSPLLEPIYQLIETLKKIGFLFSIGSPSQTQKVPKVSLNFAPLNLKTPTNPHRVVAHRPFFHHTHHKNPYFKKPEY